MAAPIKLLPVIYIPLQIPIAQTISKKNPGNKFEKYDSLKNIPSRSEDGNANRYRDSNGGERVRRDM